MIEQVKVFRYQATVGGSFLGEYSSKREAEVKIIKHLTKADEASIYCILNSPSALEFIKGIKYD